MNITSYSGQKIIQLRNQIEAVINNNKTVMMKEAEHSQTNVSHQAMSPDIYCVLYGKESGKVHSQCKLKIQSRSHSTEPEIYFSNVN
jgi:hypothetical protein